MVTSNYETVGLELEKQELEAPNGVASAQLYGQLLAIYLLQNDLCNAKYLWKRIPQSVESANPELFSIWSIGQKMWKKDLPGTYKAIAAHTWSEPIADIIKLVEEKVRERALNLIARSYSSISAAAVSAMTGLTGDALFKMCEERKWKIQDGGLTIIPVPPVHVQPQHTSSEDQLYKLTEFVSFLEN